MGRIKFRKQSISGLKLKKKIQMSKKKEIKEDKLIELPSIFDNNFKFRMINRVSKETSDNKSNPLSEIKSININKG